MRRIGAALTSAALVVLGSVPASASPVVDVQTELVAEGAAVAFVVRPTYDAGGAGLLHLFVGYADANLTTPSDADGQASWYNFGIAETAAFRPAEECTPQENLEATVGGTDEEGNAEDGTLQDSQQYVTDYVTTVARSLQEQTPPPKPTVPGPRHACTERFPGFAQSRTPPTHTIPERADDNYFDRPTAAMACREDPTSTQCKYYEQYWPSFRSVTGRFVRDGSFSTRAATGLSQRSEAVLFGAGDGMVVSVGLARSTASARLESGTVVVEAATLLDDVCVMDSAAGCTLRIDRMRHYARVRKEPGRRAEPVSQTVILGVHSSGLERDLTAKDLMLNQAHYSAGRYFQIAAVAPTHNCDPVEADPSVVVADAGGIRLAGSGGEGEQGGGIMIGGACVRARAETNTISTVPFTGDAGDPGAPPQTIVVPGPPGDLPATGPPPAPTLGAPRLVTREVRRVVFRDPVAWRTAPWWGGILGAFAVASAIGHRFRRTPAVQPVARRLDRFARQFLRG